MAIDPRCCGSGTCIVDLGGRCWCGQQWDGEKMCNPPSLPTTDAAQNAESPGATSKPGDDDAGSRFNE